MNYTNIYNLLITRAQNRTIDGYVEKHHIVPRCMNGADDRENIVELTPEEHFVAHQLLVKMYPEIDKLVFALVVMSGKNPTTNKLFGWHRRKLAEAQQRAKTGKKIGPQSEKHRAAIGNANRGKKHTQETKDRISQTKMGTDPWNKGRKGSQVPWNKGIKTGKPATAGAFKKGSVPWNKGLTKETDSRCAEQGLTRIEANIKKRSTKDLPAV